MADILIAVQEDDAEGESGVLVVTGFDPNFSLPRLINDSEPERVKERRLAAADPLKVNTEGN